MVIALALGGWTAAALAALIALVLWQALSRAREAMVRATHELRGPLTAARLGLELGGRTGELTAARLRAIDLQLSRATLALEDLTPDRRRRGGRRPPAEINIEQLLRDSIEAWRAGAAARGVELQMRWRGSPGHVWGDRVRLAQATGNLIANAIEHGGGEVVVSGRAEAGAVRIEVTDGGPGLPAPVAELERRARAGRGEHGRGLAIAGAIAREHGGRLAAAPSERGARLVLELPARGRPPVSAPVAG